MTLEDFERQLARKTERSGKEQDDKHHSSQHKRDHDRRHHHHHRNSGRTPHTSSREQGVTMEVDHRSKRRRHDSESRDHQRKHRYRRDTDHEATLEGEAFPTQTSRDAHASLGFKRDSWMETPSSLEVDYIHRKQKDETPPKSGSLGVDFELKIHRNEVNHHLKDLKSGKTRGEIEAEPKAAEAEYMFGDAGSQWRMTKLKAVYRQAQDSGRPVDVVALERYGNLRDFDNAREEEIELSRRETYGKDYVGKTKPSGDLFQERKQEEGDRQQLIPQIEARDDHSRLVEGIAVPAMETSHIATSKVDQTTLNKMKARLLRAQLRNEPQLEQLQREYDLAASTLASDSNVSPVIALSAMNSRMLSTAPRNEVKVVNTKRGAEKGLVEDNEDMSIEDMVREEKRSRGQAGDENKRFAERIAKDGKFDNDLDYMEENAAKLAKRVHKTEANLRNMAIGEYQKFAKILDNCPLCHHEDTETPPIAPIVSLATRTFLTLPTEPELVVDGAMIVPIQHHVNLLEADDDEWEEIRNFMKSLTRLYHDQGRDVIFYENAAHPHRKPHAALVAIPLPYSQGDTAPAFFKEAFLTTEDEWSQHKKIIDTLTKSRQGLGKLAFRRTLVKEMPYFHVWFELDGGLGHIVEDIDRWPKGDLFAREIIGGMLGLEPDVIKRQGRWHRGHDGRLDGFRRRWKQFDWTRILSEDG